MRYGQIRAMDIANGPGIRVNLFVTGCTHNCPGCFNKDYQDFQYGEIYTDKQTTEIISYLDKPNIKGITILGGEPFQNVSGLLKPIKIIREYIDEFNQNHQGENKFNAYKDIWIYSGYTFEEILSNEKMLSLLKYCDVLIDGKFIQELLDLRLKFRGSSNQRILDVKKSLAKGSAVEYYQ